jgi:fatty-acyl-CoA synthase
MRGDGQPHPSRKSYFHRGGTEPLLGTTIPEHFRAVTAVFGEREALISLPQGKRFTYSELAAAVDEVARGLRGFGFGAGNRIGIWSTNNAEWFLLQLATARIGALLVNINPAYRPEELAYALERSEVQGLFTVPAFRHSDYVAMLRELLPELAEADPAQLECPRLPALRRIVLYDPTNPIATARPVPGFTTWSDLQDAARTVSSAALDELEAALDSDDPINIQYTSGTTGFPKAVLLSHHNILNNAYFAARSLRFTEADRLCIPVPFYHCFGMVLANLLCASVGACAVIPSEHFDPLAVLRAVETERCTALHGVPTMFIAELEHPRFADFDLRSLRTGIMAGAPCPPALMRRVIEEMHCREIRIGYGETEASPLTHLTEAEDSFERRTETVGRSLCHQEVKIVEPQSRHTVPLGEVGEICFRGYHVMKGYYRGVEATQEAIDPDGWLASGDLGWMDAEGYLRVTGRLKEMIIRGGENIYPAEIEEVLFAHPKVAQAAVFGVPDEFYGEEVMAWIQPHEGQQLSEEEIRDHCKKLLAHFKVPKQIRFVEEFPMTVTGKLKKFQMRKLEIEQRCAESNP